MQSPVALQRMALTAYEAATDSSKWSVLLKDLCETFGASSALLMTPGELETHKRFLWSTCGMDPQGQVDYGRHWVVEDAWLEAVKKHQIAIPRGEMLIGDSYLPRAELLKTAFYNEWAARNGIQGLVTLIIEDDRHTDAVPMTVLSLLRAPGMPAFAPDELRAYQALHPHLHRAVRMHWALAGLRDQRRTLEGALDVLPQPLFVLAADGAIEHANPAARRLLNQGTAKVSNGHLLAVGRLEAGAIASTLRWASLGMGQALGTWWSEAELARTALLRFTPLPPDSPYRVVWPRVVALMIVELLEAPGHASARLQATARRYHLTPAEIRVLECLQRGSTPAEAAQHLGVRISTVRSQIAALLEKTGARRQADLLRLL